MVFTRRRSSIEGESSKPQVTRGRGRKYVKGECGRSTLGTSPSVPEVKVQETESPLPSPGCTPDHSSGWQWELSSGSESSDDEEQEADFVISSPESRRLKKAADSQSLSHVKIKQIDSTWPSPGTTPRRSKRLSVSQSSSDEPKATDSVSPSPGRTLRVRRSKKRYSNSQILPDGLTLPPSSRRSRTLMEDESTPARDRKGKPSRLQNASDAESPSLSRRSRRSSSHDCGTPTVRLKRLPLDLQNVSNVQTPSPLRHSRRSSTEKSAMPTRRSKRLSTGVTERQDTPIVQTPKRRRRTSTDAQDTPVLPTSARRSRRQRDIGVTGSEVSNETHSPALASSGKSVEGEPLPLTEEIDGLMDYVGSTLSLESISEEWEGVPVEHSESAVQCVCVCEVEGMQILKSKPETLPVIEEEQVDVDSNSETSDPVAVMAKRERTPNLKAEVLTVTENVEGEKDISSDSLVEIEETEEKVIEKSTLPSKLTVDDVLTKEPTEKLDEKEEEQEVIKLDRGTDVSSDCSVSSMTGTDEDDLVVKEEKDVSANAVGEIEEAKEVVVKSTLQLESTTEKNIEESTEKTYEEEPQVTRVDQGTDGGSDCSISSAAVTDENDLSVADETVSTTVMTDEDYVSTVENEIKFNDLDTVMNKGSEEVPSKDPEVTSTTDMGVKAEDQENELVDSQQNEGGDQKKKDPVINDNAGISKDSVLHDKIPQPKNIPRGLPISGRWWKKEKQSFRSINKDATGKKSWGKKMKLKQERQNIMAKSAALQEEKQKKKDELKKRQQLNKIRREENAKKSEIVQVIRDPQKIKKMKRKQLRYIEKRDTTQSQS